MSARATHKRYKKKQTGFPEFTDFINTDVIKMHQTYTLYKAKCKSHNRGKNVL